MRKPEPVEIVQIAIPVLVEAVVAIFAIGVACMWVIIFATRVPVPV
jgi:hypothetical protein